MADDKKEQLKPIAEAVKQPEVLRTMTIPLRQETLKAPRYRRAGRAVTATRDFLKRHLKTEDVLLGNQLNEKLNSRGRRNPPPRITVKVYKYKGKFMADVVDAEFKIEEQEKKKGFAEKLKGLVKKETPIEQEVKEEKKEVLEHKAPREKKQHIENEDAKISPTHDARAKHGTTYPRAAKPAHERK